MLKKKKFSMYRSHNKVKLLTYTNRQHSPYRTRNGQDPSITIAEDCGKKYLADGGRD